MSGKTMKNGLKTITLLLLIISAASCKAPEKKLQPPRDDSHRISCGKAVIKEIVETKDSTNGGNRGFMDIYFDFIPSDPEAPGSYLCRECPDKRIRLFYDNRDSFHLNWIKKWDIKPGSEYPAARHEMIRKDRSAAVSHEVILDPPK